MNIAAMASPLVHRSMTCLSCTRQISSSLGNLKAHAGQQIRGKKKLAKVTTVRVQLRQNVPGYGRKGAVIPVTAGVMRNIWYPKGMAEYVTTSNLHELGVKKESALERDSTFRSSTEKKIERQTEVLEKEKQKEIEMEEFVHPVPFIPSLPEAEPESQMQVELMSPETAISILEDLLPQNLDFYRTTIAVPRAPRKISPSLSSSSILAAEAANTKLESNKIHGSVTTSDIATNLKAILAEDEQGSRVVIAAEDISFTQETEEKDRVKQLGIFEIEIKLDGAPDSVRRTIQVNAQS